MHFNYLGDAKDLAKRGIFSLLGPACGTANLVGSLQLVPFLPFRSRVRRRLNLYRRILGSERATRIVPLSKPWTSRRAQRMVCIDEAIRHLRRDKTPHTVFLDPDTGVVRQASRRRKRSHIGTDEINRFLREGSDRIVVAYDESFSHKRRSPVELRRLLKSKVTELRRLGGESRIDAFAYHGQALNLILVGNEASQRRLTAIKKRMKSLLGKARIVEPRRESR